MSFNINAAVVLSGPKNIAKVRSSIQKQLSNISVPVRVKVDKGSLAGLTNIDKQLNTLNSNLRKLNATAKGTSSQLKSLAASGSGVAAASNKVTSATNQINKSLDKTAKAANIAGSEIQAFGKDAALAVRRFAAFSIATGVIFGFTRAVSQATGEAIKFERELAKITQVTGKVGRDLSGLKTTIDGLSTSLGLNANELLDIARTFAQTGQSLTQVEKSLKAVARASLAPTFGDIKQTTEGAIAALNQFGIGADRLESILGSLNQVSKRFAVEADDLISVIRRAGGVFAASSQQLGAPEERLRELIGIFTAVRSTTRESADTIATGLRTIFTRIQRPQTIEFLKQFGVQLKATAVDAKRLGVAEGDFIGIFEALKRISAASKTLDTLSTARLVEELGGVRQVGKLLPALRNFEKAERARQEALRGTSSITKDVAIATQTLSVQIEQLQQRFGKLIRDVSQSGTFQNLAKFAIGAANAFITLADALRPILPAITAIAAVKLTGGVFKFAQGFIGGIRKGGGAEGVGGGIAGALTGGTKDDAASVAATKQATSVAQKNVTSLNANTTALKALDTSIKSLQSTSTNLNTNAANLNRQATALIGALKALPSQLRASIGGGAIPIGGRRRRAAGGKIPKFGKGGFVDGPSHAQGGVLALLEGGEAVIPKKDVRQSFPGGGRAYKRKRMKDGGKVFLNLADGKFGGLFLTPPEAGDSVENIGSAGIINKQKRVQKRLIDKANSALKSGTIKGKATEDPPQQKRDPNKLGSYTFGQGVLKNVSRKDFDAFVASDSAPIPKGVDATPSQRKKLITQRNNALKAPAAAAAAVVPEPITSVAVRGLTSRFVASDADIRKGIDEETTAAARQGMDLALEKALDSPSLRIGGGNLKLSPADIERSVGPLFKNDPDGRINSARAAIQGYLLEGIIAAVGNFQPQSSEATFDFLFEKGSGIDFESLGDFFGGNVESLKNLRAADAKRSLSESNVKSIYKKTADYLSKNSIGGSGFFSFAADGMEIPGKGMVPVAISNGEGLVDPKLAGGNLKLLERARQGFGAALDAVSTLPIEDVVGPGTGTSDSIKTNLAAGTFVLPASSMRAIEKRRQRAGVGGIIGGIGTTIRQDPGRALSLGTGVGFAASGIDTSSTEAFRDSLLNAALTLAFFSGEISEFGKLLKTNIAAASAAGGTKTGGASAAAGASAAGGRAAAGGGRGALKFLSTATVGEAFAGVKEQFKTLVQVGRNFKNNVQTFRALGKRSKELKGKIAALDVEIVGANANFTQQSNLVNKLTAQRNATTSTIDKLFKKQAAYRKAASKTLPVLETQDDLLKALGKRRGIAKVVKDARNVRGNLLEKFFRVRGKRDAAEAAGASLLQTPTGSFAINPQGLNPLEEVTDAIKNIRAGNIPGGKATITSLGSAGKSLDLAGLEKVRKELFTLPKAFNKISGNITGLNIGLGKIGQEFNQIGRIIDFAKTQYTDLGLAIKSGVAGNTIIKLQDSLDTLGPRIEKVSLSAIDASKAERTLQIRRAQIADDLVSVGAQRKVTARALGAGGRGLRNLAVGAAARSASLGGRAAGAIASPFRSIGRAFSEGGLRGGARAIATSPLVNPISGFKAAGTGLRAAIASGFKSARGGITKSFDEGVRNFNAGRAKAIKKEAVQAFKAAGGTVTRTGARQLTATGGDKAARQALRQSFAEAGEIAAKGGTRAGARAALAGAANVGTKGLVGGAKLLGGPGGIAALVASLVGDPIVEGISKAAVGARKEIAGISGFTAAQGGQGQAQLVGGAKGAIQGASIGASIGLMTGPLAPVLAPLLAVLGGAGGAAIGAATAGRDQARFESVEKAQQSGDRLAEVLDRLAGEGINNVKVLNQVSAASSRLNNQIIQTANDLDRLQGAQGIREAGGFGSEFTATIFGAFEGLGAGIGTETTFFGKVEAAFDNLAVATGGLSTVFTSTAAGFAAGSVFGGIAGSVSGIANREQALQTATNRRDARLGAASVLGGRQSLATSLAAVDDEVFAKAGENFDRLGQTIIDSIPLENLGEIASLGIDASFGDLTKALKEAGDGSDKFAAQLQAFAQLQGTVIAGDLKKLDARLQGAAGEDQGLQKLFSATTNAGASFLSSFQRSGGDSDVAQATAGREFIKQLNSLRTAQSRGRGETIESLLGGTRDFAELSKLFDDAAEGSAEAEQKLARLANAIQGVDEDATSSRQSLQIATDSFRAFTDAASKGAAANLAAAAKQRLVNQILLDSQKSVDALAQALSTLATGIEGAVATFATVVSNVDQQIASILSTQQSVQGLNRGNIFDNVQGASKAELGAGVERVRAAVGGDPADFADFTDTIKLGDALPQALKDTIDGLRKNVDQISFVEFQDALKKRLEQDVDFGNLSGVVKSQFDNLLEATFAGTRQTDKLGAEQFTSLLEQTGGLEQFSELAAKSVEAFQRSINALNQFENALLKTADLQVQANRQIVDAEIKILQKREQINDRFARFTIGGTGGIAGAQARTQAEVGTLLNAAGAGNRALAIGGTGPADLLDRRSQLEQNIKDVLDQIGQRAEIDPTDTVALASLDKDEFQPLLDKLADNTSALEGTKQAIDLLSDDTRTLASVEGELAAINSQRLSERQRLQAGLQRASSARTPQEFNKIVNELQRPFIAASKLASGQQLNLQEGAALQQDLLSGNTGIVANAFRQQNPGATEDDVSAFIEKSLANFQIGGQNFFRGAGMGADAVGAVFGAADGPGATVRGEGEKEKGLLSLKDQILADQEALIKGTAEQNANAIRDREQLLRTELDATKAKLLETGDAFAELRRKQEELIESTLIAAQQLEGAKAKDEAAQAEKKAADLKASQASNAAAIDAAERAQKADAKPRIATRSALGSVIADIDAGTSDRGGEGIKNELAIAEGRAGGVGQEDFFQLLQDRTRQGGSFIGQAVSATNIEKAFGIDDAGFGGSLFNVNASFQNLEQSDVAKRSRQQVLKNIAQTVAGGKLGENEEADRIFENLRTALETSMDSGVASFTEGDKGIQTQTVSGVGDFSKVIERIIMAELRKADAASTSPVKLTTATGEEREFALGSQELKDFQAQQAQGVTKADTEAADANKRLQETQAKIETSKKQAAEAKAAVDAKPEPAPAKAAAGAKAAADAKPESATPGPAERAERQRQAERDKKIQEFNKSQEGKFDDIDLGPPVVSDEDRARLRAEGEAADQAKIDDAREKDRANAAARQQPAAKAAVGNLKAPSGRFAGTGTTFETLEGIREGKSLQEFRESVGSDSAEKFFAERKDRKARAKQAAAEARDPRKRTRRLAEEEKRASVLSRQRARLQEAGGSLSEQESGELGTLKDIREQFEGRDAFKQFRETVGDENADKFLELNKRQTLGQSVIRAGGQIPQAAGQTPENIAAQQQQEAAQLNKQQNTAKAKQITQEQTDLKKNQQLQQQKQQQQQQEIQQAPTAAATQDPTAKFVQAVEALNTSKFATELLAAATKLESLPDINITLNSEPIDVNVILNGGQLLAEFRKEFQDQIFDEVANQIAANNSNIDGGQPVV